MKLILASGSPRRQELLTQIGLTDFTVHPADVDESVEPGTPPEETVLSLSRRKAEAVSRLFPEALILAADTVVYFDGHILGKPHSEADAVRTLSALSGHAHQVYTGFTLCSPGQTESGVECSYVTFRDLTQKEIAAYVATGEPMDKAGAYGIQGRGALFITGIQGDYFNVMGLPLCRLGVALQNFGVDPWKG